jgi:hypothetical protein
MIVLESARSLCSAQIFVYVIKAISNCCGAETCYVQQADKRRVCQKANRIEKNMLPEPESQVGICGLFACVSMIQFNR